MKEKERKGWGGVGGGGGGINFRLTSEGRTSCWYSWVKHGEERGRQADRQTKRDRDRVRRKGENLNVTR